MRRIAICGLTLILLGALAAPAPTAPVATSSKKCSSFKATVAPYGDRVRLFHVKAYRLTCKRARELGRQAMKQTLPSGWNYRRSGPFMGPDGLYSSGKVWKGRKRVTFDIASA